LAATASYPSQSCATREPHLSAIWSLQASKSSASNAEQRTHPNVCGPPNTNFDVLKKRSNITDLNEQSIIL
jgi:hypothetical protein